MGSVWTRYLGTSEMSVNIKIIDRPSNMSNACEHALVFDLLFVGQVWKLETYGKCARFGPSLWLCAGNIREMRFVHVVFGVMYEMSANIKFQIHNN